MDSDSEEKPKLRPRNLKLSKCREGELRDCMNLSKEQFNAFKSVVEKTAMEMLPCVPRTRQRPVDWELFIHAVNTHLPRLGTFIGGWHILACFSILRRDPAIQREWQQKHSEKAVRRANPSVVKKKVKYVGKLVQRRILHNTGTETLSESASQIGNAPVQPEPSPSPVGATSRLSLLYPAPCTVCGFFPLLTPPHTKNLRRFFDNAEDLLQVLVYIGILHDRHLRMILNWSTDDRVAFLNGIHPDRIKPTDKQRLVKLFTSGPSPSTSAAPASPPNRSRREREYDPIAKPPQEVERRIASGQAPLSELMQAMALQNAQEFQAILQTIDTLYAEYERQLAKDLHSWISFFGKVYNKCPVMRLFQEGGPEENNWAIKLYLRRKLNGSVEMQVDDNQAMTNGQENGHANLMWSNISNPDNNLPRHSVDSESNARPYPGVTLSTCPVHFPPDYRLSSPRLKHLLNSHGAEELFPVFITVGIRTDQALNALGSLAKQDRTKEFVNPARVHLTDLQDFALRLILNKL